MKPAIWPSDLITFPRQKPRGFYIVLAFRLFYLARKILPFRLLSRFLVEAARLCGRFAGEIIWSRLSPKDAMELTRPRTLPFIHKWLPPDGRVIDWEVAPASSRITLPMRCHLSPMSILISIILSGQSDCVRAKRIFNLFEVTRLRFLNVQARLMRSSCCTC